MSEEELELCVVWEEAFLQEGPQAVEEGQGVQCVEGEAAGVGHQVLARGVHRAGRCVRHHVAIHGTAQGRWDNTTQGESVHKALCYDDRLKDCDNRFDNE